MIAVREQCAALVSLNGGLSLWRGEASIGSIALLHRHLRNIEMSPRIYSGVGLHGTYRRTLYLTK